VAAKTPHSVTLAWDPAVNSGSFTYVIEASFGYRVGVPQTKTSYIWTRDMSPGRTYSFVMWAGDAKGRESAKTNKVPVTLPVDTTPPVASVTGTTSSTVGLAWDPVADDDSTCCAYRVSANGVPVTADNLQWTGERAATTQPTTDTTGPTAPDDLYAFDFGCETWLFWTESVDDVDPQHAMRYEVRVNGVFDGAQTGIDRWTTYGTQTSNTFSVQAVDSAGNRSPASSITLTNQAC
jgi:hypothetical protein